MKNNTPYPMRDHDFLKAGLHDLCRYLQESISLPLYGLSICEIGSYAGESSIIFSDYFKQVTCIDPWSDEVQDISDPAYSYAPFSEVEKAFDLSVGFRTNLNKIKGFSDDVFEELYKRSFRFDVIYIDGLHTYEQVKKDIQNYKQLSNLAVCGHDYNENNWPGVKKAVDESFTNSKIISFVDTSWAVIL